MLRPRFVLAIALVAAAAAAFAIAFRGALAFVFEHLVQAGDVVAAMKRAPWWLRLAAPAGGGLLAGLLGLAVARRSGGHGVGDVMEAVVLGRVRLPMRVTLMKSLGSWFAIVTGGSIGREGPLIQFGGAIGKLVGERLALSASDMRILIAAGTAAGFSAAYNTPFAALLFVLEVVTGVVVIDAVVPAVIATVIATALTRNVVGPGPVYGDREFALRSPWELLAFAALGVLCAVGAQGFMRMLSFGERLFQRPSLPLPWRTTAGGAACGAILVAVPEVAGNGYEPLNAVLDSRLSISFVLVLLVAKALATTASVSSGSPGGVFTPTLLIGGAMGFAFGVGLAHVIGPHVGPPGGYALVGMAAASAATTHAPLMAAVMAFELSGDYAIVLPLLTTTTIATAISRRMRKSSIYTAELHERGIEWEMTLDRGRVIDP